MKWASNGLWASLDVSEFPEEILGRSMDVIFDFCELYKSTKVSCSSGDKQTCTILRNLYKLLADQEV